MIIKSIRLYNIRSYESQEIKFPNGSVLLSGDIGSGKSTILLAIEFAIFGAKKGELPAYVLLRHGKKEGSVELRMEVEGKDIIIKRVLRRHQDDIRQDAGYVIVNGVKKDATSEELRAVILEMLGYPKDLIKKGKDLIYRYTVYTPQEEMKQILYENNDVRLDTLRKVFNIDKCKRVRDNSKIVLSMLKEKKRYIEGFTLDLEGKKKDLGSRKNEVLELDSKSKELSPKLEEVKLILNQTRKSIEEIESQVKELNILKKEFEIAGANLTNKIDQNNRLNEEIKRIEKQIEDLQVELKGKALLSNNFSARMIEKEEHLAKIESEYKSILKEIREAEIRLSHSDETIKKILSLDVCPVCAQKVDENHKHYVNQKENDAQILLVEKLRSLKGSEDTTEKNRFAIKKEIDVIMQEQSNFNIIKLKFQNLDEKKRLREEKILLKEKTKKEIGMLNAKKAEINSKISIYSGVEEKYKAVRKEIDDLLPQERFLESEKKGIEREKASILRFIKSLEKEIDEKTEAKSSLNKISQISNWIDEFFCNLMSTIEKHVMVNIHSQFTQLFNNWFSVLMEDNTINVRVDEDFTPIIEQNGYETFIENLSGGEKTSVALSYRLALNKVINDIVAGIKTKELIILDEPTDGFSNEQLDKVRDLLKELNMKQVIIVSHEGKIESFVQNVIRIEKHDHASLVV